MLIGGVNKGGWGWVPSVFAHHKRIKYRVDGGKDEKCGFIEVWGVIFLLYFKDIFFSEGVNIFHTSGE